MIEIPLNELPPGTLRQVKHGTDHICLANVEGEIFAVSDRCTHAGIPLSDGALEGRQVICPWHGAMFDLKTGHPTCGPAVESLRQYKVTRNGNILNIHT